MWVERKSAPQQALPFKSVEVRDQADFFSASGHTSSIA